MGTIAVYAIRCAVIAVAAPFLVFVNGLIDTEVASTPKAPAQVASAVTTSLETAPSLTARSQAVVRAPATPGDLSGMSRQVLTYAKKGDWLAARAELWNLSTAFSQYNWKDAAVSVEGIHALADTLVRARQALTKAAIEAEDVRLHAVRLRLAFDALERREQPLWHAYYDVLTRDAAHLRRVLPKGRKADIVAAVDRLHSHYTLIEPALYVARTPGVVQQVNALFAATETHIRDTGINREPLIQLADHWQKIWHPLFYGTDEEVMAVKVWSVSPLYPVAWLLAGLIGSVLAFVAWSKAQQQRETDGV
ncbi:sporulation protein YpjB [Numidum massiliense]|uniref:sporulation protein YpjB n=1 Tax=Numidum massiliense TaxID=1522315 RepID=UPI0006D53FE8|nr:sporulation protein YpjB [Numidum massiliense]